MISFPTMSFKCTISAKNHTPPTSMTMVLSLAPTNLQERPDVVLQGFAFVQKNKFGVYHIGKHNCQNNGNHIGNFSLQACLAQKEKAG